VCVCVCARVCAWVGGCLFVYVCGFLCVILDLRVLVRSCSVLGLTCRDVVCAHFMGGW